MNACASGVFGNVEEVGILDQFGRNCFSLIIVCLTFGGRIRLGNRLVLYQLSGSGGGKSREYCYA